MADKIEKLTETVEKLIQKLSGESSELNSASSKSTEQLEAEIAATKEYIELLNRSASSTKDYRTKINSLNEIKRVQNELSKQELELKKRILEQDFKNNKITVEQYLQEKKNLEQQEKKIKKLKELKDIVEQTAKSTARAAAEFLGLSKGLEMVKPAGLIQTAGELSKLNAELAKTGIIFDDAFATFPDITKESNKSLGIFVGQARKANGEIMTMTQFGAGFKELIESFGGLRDSMAAFSDLSPAVQQNLAGNAARMKNLGASIELQGKNWNFLTKSLKLSAIEAGQTTDKIVAAGLGANISAKKMLQDFSNIGPQLAAQGKKALDVFVDLEKQAKALGVEVSALMNVFGSALDTFEGVAQAAGKFNAVMGGDFLNSMELLNATESQRVEIVKRAMDATGKSFDSMSKYEKIAVANALGIKDLNEAQQILGVSSIEMQIKKREEAATQEKLIKLQQQAVDIASRLASVFQVVYGAVLPFVKVMEKAATTFLEWNDEKKGLPGIIIVGGLIALFLKTTLIPAIFRIGTSMKGALFGVKGSSLGMMGNFKKIGMAARGAFNQTQREAMKAAGGVKTAGGMIKSTFAGIGAASKSLGRSLGGITVGGFIGGLMSLIPLVIMLWEAFHDFEERHSDPVILIISTILPKGLDATGQAAQRNGSKLFGLAAAALGIGGAIFLAAYGIAELVKAFNGLNKEQIDGANIAIALFGATIIGIIVALGGLMETGIAELGVGALLALGGAALMMGGAIALAAWGMSKFVDSITGLAKESNAVPTIAALAGGIIAVSAAVGVLGVSLTGFALLGLGVMGGVWLLEDAIEDLGSAIQKFPAEKSIQFTASTKAITDALYAANALSSDSLKPSIELLNTAKQYIEVSATSRADDPAVRLLNKILEIINAAASKKTTEGQSSSRPSDVSYKLELDGVQFGKLIGKYSSNSPEKTVPVMAR